VTLTGQATVAITGNTCAAASLAPGQTCSITVRFAPDAEGPMTATLTATSTSPVATATDALSGTGVAPALYWASDGDGTAAAGSIWRAGLNGSSPQAIATGQNDPFGVAATANQLYWANSGAGTITEAGLDGSNTH